MTCRDLILYILENGLEDEPVFKDGKFIGFLTPNEAAEEVGTGIATIYALAKEGNIPNVMIKEGLYIPVVFRQRSRFSTKLKRKGGRM